MGAPTRIRLLKPTFCHALIVERTRGRALRCGDGDTGAQRDARHETCRSPHAPSGFRPHHQQRQHRRTARRLFVAGGLRRGQGRGDSPHQCLAMELGESGILVNGISPGAIATGIIGKSLGFPVEAAERTPAIMREIYKTQQPIQRAGLPGDIAPRGGISRQRRIQLHQRPRRGSRRRHHRRPQLEPAATGLRCFAQGV
jgi:hypothetical protein